MNCPPMSLYSYHAPSLPPGLQATRMLAMVPGLLHDALSLNGTLVPQAQATPPP